MASNGHYSLSALRRGLASFAVGKPITGLLRLAIVLMIVQALDKRDYGTYLGLEAAIQTMLALSLVGCDWVALRYLPEYRAKSSNARVMVFALKVLALRLAVLVAVFLCIWWQAEALVDLVGLDGRAAVLRLFLFVLLFDGIAEFLRAVIFEALLWQGAAQSNMVFRNALFVFALAVSWWLVDWEQLGVQQVITVEIVATCAALVLAVMQFLWYGSRNASTPGDAAADLAIPVRDMLMLGWNNYLSHLLAIGSSLQLVLLVITRMFGPETASSFGFAKTLTDQARKYLPATLLAGLIRPKLIADYAVGGDFQMLNRRAVLVYKVSMVLLAVALVILGVAGAPLLDLISGGKFGAETGLVIAMLLTLVPFVHRTTLTTVANALTLSSALAKGAASALVALPLVVVTLEMGFGLISAAIAVLAGELLHNIVILRSIRRAGHPYQVATGFVFKLAIVCLVSASPGLLLQFLGASVAGISIALASSMALFAGFLWLFRPIDQWERSSLRRIIGRPPPEGAPPPSDENVK